MSNNDYLDVRVKLTLTFRIYWKNDLHFMRICQIDVAKTVIPCRSVTK